MDGGWISGWKWCGLTKDHLTFSLSVVKYVRRQPGEEFQRQCLQPTVKHGGGSIMIWGCVSGAGMGKLKSMEGKVNAEAYYRILRHQMGSNMKLQGGWHLFIFMQDNASVHS